MGDGAREQQEAGAGVVLDLGELSRRAEADEFRALGEERQAQGDVEDAAAYFQMSLDLYPTAEAHVALAHALAARGRWDDAVGECEKAIRLDPELGNPYNDIGVYLDRKASEVHSREERRLLSDAALRYFDRAIASPTYDCRHYPHYHRGRLLEQRGRFTEARDAYHTALQIEPGWEAALVAWRRTLGFLN
jgi:tetratricopeptide (TPR) repeat protein